MSTPTFPTTPVIVTLADNKPRELRYTLGAVKRIKERYAQAAADEAETKLTNYAMVIQGRILGAIGKEPEEALPFLLMQGLVDLEGLTEQRIQDLITGPMVEYISLCVVEAFFGPRLAKGLRANVQLQDAVVDELIDKARNASKPKPKAAELTPNPSLLN